MLLREMTLEYVESLKYVEEIPRRFSLPDPQGDVLALVGPRRVGKTFQLLKRAKQLLDGGAQVVYATFDDIEVRGWTARRFAEEVRAVYPRGKVALFLDEVQEWPGWDAKVRWLHDVKDFDIYITGSTAELTLEKVPSRLRGRYRSLLLLPLSFAEIAKTAPLTFRERGAVRSLFEEYVKWGGFPEVWKSKSPDKLRSLLDTIFYRDVVERRRVKDVEAFERLFYLVLENYSNPITWRRLAKAADVDHKTAANYVKYMQEAYLLFVVELHGPAKSRAAAPRKIYLVDPAFTNLTYAGRDAGRKMENLLFLHLLRRALRERGKIRYLKIGDEEVDFVYSTQRGVELYEAAYEPDERHVKKCRKATEKIGAPCRLVTWDEAEGAVPIWRLLLEEPQEA
ncbi:MAG: ATP-binding protein [Pyrobaculum sp.]